MLSPEEKMMANAAYGKPRAYVVACIMAHNEEAIIGRCIESLKDNVDAIYLQDHHSTDNTITTALDAAGSTGVTTCTARWSDFAANRNTLIALAPICYSQYSNLWLLLVDCDHTVNFIPGWRNWLTQDQTDILTLRHTGDLAYWVPRLIRPGAGHYIGATHEYFQTHGSPTRQFTGITITDHADGSSHAVKYERDITLLTSSLKFDPDNARTWFYLGQSYRDLNNYIEAERCYAQCVEHTCWDEERYYAMYQRSYCAYQNGDDWLAAVYAWQAHIMRPTRIESIVLIAQRENRKGRTYVRTVLECVKDTPIPADVLFVETAKWTWRNDTLAQH